MSRAEEPAARTVAVVGGRVIDGLGGEALENGCVLVEGGRIAWVGPAESADVPDAAERIDALGKTVLPGFLDAHMHVTSFPESLDTLGHLKTNLRAVGKLRKCLAWGATTVVNMGGCPENVALRDAIEQGHLTGCARMMVAALVNATGGHVRGRAADGPWEARKAVREMILGRADLIKTAASGGFMWEHERVEWEDYTVAELIALVEEAHGKGKRVCVHAHSQPGLAHSIEAGVDMIHHGALADQAAIEGILQEDLWFVPTLYITSERVFQRKGIAAHMAERMAHAHPIHRRAVRMAHEMGVKIAAGTDGGPGSVMLEMGELVACGLTPMEAIVTATRNTADALGVLDDRGTLEPGKRADLVVVEGDPLEDIAVLAELGNILLVMKDGKVEATDEARKQYLHPREMI